MTSEMPITAVVTATFSALEESEVMASRYANKKNCAAADSRREPRQRNGQRQRRLAQRPFCSFSKAFLFGLVQPGVPTWADARHMVFLGQIQSAIHSHSAFSPDPARLLCSTFDCHIVANHPLSVFEQAACACPLYFQQFELLDLFQLKPNLCDLRKTIHAKPLHSYRSLPLKSTSHRGKLLSLNARL